MNLHAQVIEFLFRLTEKSLKQESNSFDYSGLRSWCGVLDKVLVAESLVFAALSSKLGFVRVHKNRQLTSYHSLPRLLMGPNQKCSFDLDKHNGNSTSKQNIKYLRTRRRHRSVLIRGLVISLHV